MSSCNARVAALERQVLQQFQQFEQFSSQQGRLIVDVDRRLARLEEQTPLLLWTLPLGQSQIDDEKVLL